MKKLPFYAILFFTMQSCVGGQSNITNEKPITVVEDNKTYILTYLIKVKKEKGKKNETFEIQNVIKKEGFMKTGSGFDRQVKEGKLVLEFLDADDNIIQQIYEHNPLRKHFEVPSPDGKIESKTVEVKEEVIGVRMNYNSKVEQLRISKIEKGEKIFLTIIDLINNK